MQLIRVGKRWIAQCPYEEKDTAKAAGFRWDPNAREWYTTIKDCALKLREYAKGEAKRELDEIVEREKSSIEMSKSSENGDIDIPIPEGLELYPFQKAGVAYIVSRKNVFLADEMGIGKTPQSIAAMNYLNVRSALIICPASIKINWKREVQRWSTTDLSVDIVDKKFPDTDVVIINYERLKKHYDDIRVRDWDLLIADECHAIKNFKAQRTQQIIGKWDKKKASWSIVPIRAGRKWFLTGTPILNRPSELWTAVSMLAKDEFNFWYFHKRYCDGFEGPYGWDFSGASHLDELQRKLRSTIMCRRLKSEVLTELPPKQRQVIELPTEGVVRQIDRERQQWEAISERLSELRVRVELARISENDTEYRTAVKSLRNGTMASFEEIAKLRHETALKKLPIAIEHLRDIEESDQKCVVFAHHRDVLEKLHSEFPNSVLLYGGMSEIQKQESIDRFQNSDVQFFFGSIKAAGVGITLTAASLAVFVELDWVPAIVSQAEDRLHRIGTTGNVLIQHLVFEGSIDAMLAHTLVDKQEIIEKALDKNVEWADPHIPILPGVDMKNSVMRQVGEIELTNDQIEAIHEGLKLLSQWCDGAYKKDDSGFNIFDTHMGKALAAFPNLTPKQAQVGFALVRKYRRQLPESILNRCGL